MSSRRDASVPARAASSNATLRLSVARRRPARSRLPVTPASAPYSVVALAETKLYPASSLAERNLNLPNALAAVEPSKGELKVGVSELTKRGRNASRACCTSSAAARNQRGRLARRSFSQASVAPREIDSRLEAPSHPMGLARHWACPAPRRLRP